MSRRGVNSWTRTAMGRIWIQPAERRTPYVFSGGLKVTPNVLPASCRQTVACRIVPFCRQDAGYVFSVFAGRANGARTLVRSKIGRRRSLEISKRGSALPAFLRDKSRAPGEFLVGALNRYDAGSTLTLLL